MNLLGCAWTYLPVIFDLWYESTGQTSFQIYKNIPVEGEPVMTNGNPYVYDIHEPGAHVEQSDKGVTFGLTGPKAKHVVFNYFRDRQQLDASQYISLVHPTVYRPVTAMLEGGHIFEPGVIISSHAKLAFGVTMKRGASVGHHSSLGAYTEINPGVIISSGVTIGRGCILGTGSMVKDGVTIGENTLIGMGSVVTKDIPAGVVAYGNPCKVVANNEKGIPTIIP
jgi:serine acetyltransferase